MHDVEAGSADQDPKLPWGALAPHNQTRLAHILAVQIPEVFRLNRVIEQQTGYGSEIGKSMMVDVLSHLGTLAQRGSELSDVQEASQLSKIEEHLRRAIIEHPEQVVRNRVVDVADRWGVYQREAFPYREQGTLPNAPRHRELEEMRARISNLLETARSKKPDETTWDESLDAAAAMTEAAHLAGDLLDKLEQCIGAAQERKRADERDLAAEQREHANRRRWRIGIAVAAVLSVGTFVGGLALGSHEDHNQNKPLAPGAKQTK